MKADDPKTAAPGDPSRAGDPLSLAQGQIDASPDDPNGYELAARALLSLKRGEDAIPYLIRATSLAGEQDRQKLVSCLLLAMNQCEHVDAFSVIQDPLSIVQLGDLRALERHTAHLLRLRRFEEAEVLLRLLIRIEPSNHTFWGAWGTTLAMLRKWSEAAEAFATAAAYSPETAIPWLGAIRAATQADQPRLALEYLQRGLSRCDQLHEEIARRLPRLPAGSALTQKSFQDVTGQLYLGQCFEASGRSEQATSLYRDALRMLKRRVDADHEDVGYISGFLSRRGDLY